MNSKEAEELVRARWDGVQWTMGPNPWTLRISCARYFDGTQDECWLAAAEFTVQHKEEIRKKRIQIRWVRDAEIPQWSSLTFPDGTKDGILTILEAQLAALLVGWKETP